MLLFTPDWVSQCMLVHFIVNWWISLVSSISPWHITSILESAAELRPPVFQATKCDIDPDSALGTSIITDDRSSVEEVSECMYTTLLQLTLSSPLQWRWKIREVQLNITYNQKCAQNRLWCTILVAKIKFASCIHMSNRWASLFVYKIQILFLLLMR